MSVNYAQAFCSADTNITSTSYADVTGCTISLGVGTWQVMASVSLANPNGQDSFYVKLYNATDSLDLAAQTMSLRATFYTSGMVLKRVIVLAGTKSIRLAAKKVSANCVIQRFSSGAIPGTVILAIQLA